MTQPTNQTSAGEVERMRLALEAEIDRQCGIGAGMAQTLDDTGLFSVNADIDIRSLARAAIAAVDSTADREGWTRCQGEAAADFDGAATFIMDLRDRSPFHSVSHDALTTYASNLSGWARQIRDKTYTPPSHAAEPIETCGLAYDPTPWPAGAAFNCGDLVEKKGIAKWRGTVVGWYRPSNGKLGYAIESIHETGSVQIYPEAAIVALAGGQAKEVG